MADDLEAVIAAEVAKAEAGEIDYEGSEVSIEPDDAVVEETPVEEKPAEKVVEKPIEEPKPDEDLDFDKVPALDQRKRENRIPHKDVTRIVKTAEKRLAALVLGKDPDATKPFADQVKQHIARIPELETKVKAYEEEVVPMRTLGQVMATDGEKFLKILESAYPQIYGALLKKPVVPKEEPKPDFSTMPEPDYKLPDGSMTYSLEGNKKLMEWNNQQLIAKLRAEAKAEVEATNKPLTDRINALKELEASNQRVATKVAQAREWPGFTANEADIVAVVNKATAERRQITLEAAYAQVMDTKLKAAESAKEVNREALRQEIIKEIKAAPVSTAVTPSTTDTKLVEPITEADGGDDPISAAIRKAVRERK